MTLPDTRNDPEVIQLLRQHRLALIAREDDQTKRMARTWYDLETRLKDDMTLLALQIIEEQAKGSSITEQLIRRLDRYKKLNEQMKVEVLKYVKGTAIPDIEKEQLEYGKLAIQSAYKSIQLSLGQGLSFDRLPVDAVETYVGLLGDGTPLYRLLKEAYPDSLDGVVKSIIEGASRGLSPISMANNMAEEFGLGLDRITLIARTEQLRVNRLVSAEQYRASGLDGYMRRVATKDDRVCMACLVSDGELIGLEKELDDHPRGRCVAIFQIFNTPTISWERGPEWFERQDEDLQREMMGDKKYELWKAGAFDLSELRRTTHNDTWGDSPREATITELLDGKDPSKFISLPPSPIDPTPAPQFDKYHAPMAELEDMIINQDYETAGLYDSQGNLIFVKDGGKSNVTFSAAECVNMLGGILTHNHPSGGPFSKQDLIMLGDVRLKEIRAIGRGTNYTYSMINEGLKSISEKKIHLLMNDAIHIFWEEYKAGKHPDLDENDWINTNHEVMKIFAQLAKWTYSRTKRSK